MSKALELLSRLGTKGQSLDMPTDPSYGGLTWEVIAGALAAVKQPGQLILDVKYVGRLEELDGLIQLAFDHIIEDTFKNKALTQKKVEILKRVVIVATNEHIHNTPCKKCEGRTMVLKSAVFTTCTKCGGSGKAIKHASLAGESDRRRAELCNIPKTSFQRTWGEVYLSVQRFLEDEENHAAWQFTKGMKDGN